MFRKLWRLVFDGLLTVLPLAVTVYALWWLGSSAEGLLGPRIKQVLGWAAPEGKTGADLYIPGMGVAAGFVVLVVVGILARLWIAQKLLAVGDRIFARIPLAKTIYGSVKDLLSVFSQQRKSFSNVAFLKIPGTSYKILGMVTREDFPDIPQVDEGQVSIYLPMSYQIGGFTFMVPRESLETVDMTIEEAMRFAMTAAVSAEKAPVVKGHEFAEEVAKGEEPQEQLSEESDEKSPDS